MKLKTTILIFFVAISFVMFSQSEEIEYYENGTVKLRCKIINEIKQKTYYYPNGKIQTVSNWKGEKQEGLMIDYYENGNIKYYTHFHNGLINGAEIKYFENGVPSQIQTLINGKVEGPVSHFNEDGTLVSFYAYVNGQNIGAVFYFPNGQVKQKGSLDENGTGQRYHYDIDGEMIEVWYFENGVLIKKEKR